MEHLILSGSFGVEYLAHGFHVAREAENRHAAIDLRQVSIRSEKMKIGWASSAQIWHAGIVIAESSFIHNGFEWRGW